MSNEAVEIAAAAPLTPARMRAEMPVAERIAYFDHAAVAPLPRPASEAIGKWLTENTERGDTVWLSWHKQVEEARKSAARLINASVEEIALVPNTTAGINYVAEGIDWRPGDNVVILGDEYPSNAYPWMHQQDRGVETRLVATDFGRLDLDKLREACDQRTRVVSVSFVSFSNGYRHDYDAICEIAHDAGAYFLLDAIQGLGVFPVDVQKTPIDFVAADGHKWMLGPEGAGMTFIRRDRLERLRAIGVGAASVVNKHNYSELDYRLVKTAARYEGGSMNMSGLIGWGASLDLLAKWAPEDLAGAVLDVTDLAVDRLQSVGAEVLSHRVAEPGGHDPRSGIISFTLPGRDPMQARQRCLDAGVALSCRAGRLRVAAHCYNNEEDVERMIEALMSE